MTILSKSEYLMFLKHPAWLWLKKHDKNKLPEPDPNQQAMFDAGNLFESFAEELFDNVTHIGFTNYGEYLSMPERTKKIIQTTKVLSQARFEANFSGQDKITCITDIIEKVGDNELDLYEIKSSTKVKPEHIEDLAFQLLVLEECGYKVKNIYVIYCNNNYVRQGQIDSNKLSMTQVVTSEVRSKLEFCKKAVQQALDCVALEEMPDPTPRRTKLGGYSDWLKIFLSLQPQKNNYSIYKLAQAKPEQLGQLEDKHIESLHDIPSGFLLKPVQKRQIKATKLGEPIIEIDKINKFISGLEYPLYFLDYETLGSVIPPFDGLKPYQQLPFQYSLHVIESPGSNLKHLEFLHVLDTNPVSDLLKSLQESIGKQGSILVWYEGFEKSCNDLMGRIMPEYYNFLADVNSRVVDLMVPFSKGWYVDANFYGSASIKNVLPVIAPELSYKDLEISEGASAQRLWMGAVYDNAFSVAEKNKIMKNLLAYCELDTYAMVKIFEYLLALTKGTKSDSKQKSEPDYLEQQSLF